MCESLRGSVALVNACDLLAQMCCLIINIHTAEYTPSGLGAPISTLSSSPSLANRQHCPHTPQHPHNVTEFAKLKFTHIFGGFVVSCVSSCACAWLGYLYTLVTKSNWLGRHSDRTTCAGLPRHHQGQMSFEFDILSLLSTRVACETTSQDKLARPELADVVSCFAREMSRNAVRFVIKSLFVLNIARHMCSRRGGCRLFA